MKHILYLLLFTVNLNAQTDTSVVVWAGVSSYSETYGYKPDTIKVIYVLLQESDLDLEGNIITYPEVTAIYGNLIYKFGKGNEHYDLNWNQLEEDNILHIKKRTLKK